MPGLGVTRCTPHGLLQARFGEDQLTPVSGPKSTDLGPERISRGDLARVIVRAQGLVVAVRELARRSELDPGDRAVARQDFSQPFGLRIDAIDAAHASI